MNDKNLAIKLALDALEFAAVQIYNEDDDDIIAEAITALRQALEQPRQECETCANKRRRLAQAGFLKSPLRGEEKQFFYGQDPNVLPAPDKGEINDR